MKANVIHRFGGPEVLQLENIGQPEPGAGEVLIRVKAAGINPVDWKVREGMIPDLKQLPLIPGWDVSGEVEKVGEGVATVSEGDAVFALLPIGQNGAYAEFVKAPADAVAKKPETLDHVTASSVPMAALTAYDALHALDLKKGERILVHGAAGSVGGFAVQIAKLRGAFVTAMAKADDTDYVQSLGADEVVAYEDVTLEQQGAIYDCILDVIGGEVLQRSWKALKPEGRLVSTVEEPKAPSPKQKSKIIFVSPSADHLNEIAQWIDSGQLQVRVAAVLSLEDARQAQEMARMTHHHGKIVLQVA